MVRQTIHQAIVQAGAIRLHLLHQVVLLQVLLHPVHLPVEAVVAVVEEAAVAEEEVNLFMLKSI